MKKIVIIAFVVMGLAAPMSAAPITGKLNFSGAVSVSGLAIDWLPLGGGEGVILTGASTDYFSGIYNPAVVPSYFGNSTDLVGQVLPLPGFLDEFKEEPEVASEYDDLSFTLTQIVAPSAPPCTGAEAVNQACSLGVFTLLQTAGGGVDVTFDVKGFFVDPTYGDDGSLNTAAGIYTTQLSQTTIQNIINTLDAGGNIVATYSATYTASAIPEPATLLTFGAGSLLFGAHRRRRAKKKQNA